MKANPATFFTSGDWMLSQSRTTSSERSGFVVLGTAKLRHRNSISWLHNARKTCIKKNFDGIHDRFQRDSENRDSPRRSASRWINWHRKTTSTAHPLRSMRDKRKTGIERPEPVPVYQYQRVAFVFFFQYLMVAVE